MRRAFYLEPTEYPVDQAGQYGKVIQLFRSKKDHPPPLDKRFGAALIKKLDDYQFNADEDYLIATGHMQSMVIMVGTVIEEYGPISVLCFDGDAKGYVSVTIGDVNARDRKECVR